MTRIHEFPRKKIKAKPKAAGVTILFNGTGLITGSRDNIEDQKLVYGMVMARKKWLDEGRPLSMGRGFDGAS